MSEVSLESWLMLIAIIVEGPIVWWIAKRKDDKQDLEKEFKKVHARISKSEQTSREYVDQKITHVEEKNALMFSNILDELRYIRGRIDDSSTGTKESH